MIKDFVKNVIGSQYSTFDYPILVNSYGRSGSTVLTNSIIKNAVAVDNTIIKKAVCRSISEYAWSLDKAIPKDGIIYKTHDYPPVNGFENKVKMLYTFADPVDVVLSLLRLYEERGEEWMKEHYDHLKVPYTNFADIVYEDQLRLENHLDSWLNEVRFPAAFVKYECMWDHQDNMSDFLGFKMKLPKYRERKANKKNNKEVIEKLKETYSPLRRKINELNDFFTNQ